MNTDLSGTWVNDFGSQMSLVVENSTIWGTYTSDTGSSGSYFLVGHCSVDRPSETLGQSVAIALYWRNIKDGVKDESWHWVGSMCGQLQFDGKMTLTNSIVVSVPFETYEKGNYIDELVFTKSKSVLPPDLSFIKEDVTELKLEPTSYPAIGQWKSLDDDMTVNIYHAEVESGLVQAILTTSNTEAQLFGFIDVDATVNMAQGVVLTGYNSVTNEAYSMSGMLNYGSDYLTLYSWMARITSPKDSFMQTRMKSITLQKIDN